MVISKEDIEKWQTYQLGKDCPKHPNRKIMSGKYGNWCGVKTAFGWCDGGWPTEQDLELMKKTYASN